MSERNSILIIDDELGPREAMRMILKDQYDVATAPAARAGIETLSKRPFDIVILDIKMPDMDGVSALKEIKSRGHDTEVIMVTAYASLETARSAIRYGALDYLIKPFDKNDLLEIVMKGLSKRAESHRSRTDLNDLLIMNRHLEKKVDDARQKFLLCYSGTIKALIQAIDAKDHYTFSHSLHVAELSVSIATVMGFSTSMKNNIRQAALIHDIGKIGVDERILKKPGSLTPSEFDEIKKHPEIGSRIVSAVPFMEEASEVILYHHERFDGSGFPRQIRENKIPLAVRIITVADAIDSMLRDRPYRKALPHEIVLKELKEGAGSQFDPEIIRLILDGTVQIFETDRSRPHLQGLMGNH